MTHPPHEPREFHSFLSHYSNKTKTGLALNVVRIVLKIIDKKFKSAYLTSYHSRSATSKLNYKRLKTMTVLIRCFEFCSSAAQKDEGESEQRISVGAEMMSENAFKALMNNIRRYRE